MRFRFCVPVAFSLILVAGCARLSDEEYDAVLCDIWYEQGKSGKSIPLVIIGKSKRPPYGGFRSGRYGIGFSIEMPATHPDFIELVERCDELLDEYNL